MNDRTLPHNLEAEKAVLGAILIDNAQFDIAAAIIDDRHFFRDAHRRIWVTMAWLADEQKAIDLVGLKDRLEATEELEECGGPAYIAALVDGVPRASNVDHYARMVKEKKTLRELIHYSKGVLDRAYNAGEESPAQILEEADAKLLDLQAGYADGRMVSLGDSSTERFARLEWRVNNRGVLTGVPTGFEELDELTMGYQPADLFLIAARPSIGKTVFAVNSAVAAAQAGRHGVIFSLEMSRQQLEDRILSSLSGIDLTRIMNGYLGEADYAKVGAAMNAMHDLPLSIDDTSARSAPSIRRACRRLKSQGRLDFVVVDYVQLMPGTTGARTTRDEQLDDIALRLKNMAKELRVPVILLSQLNRDSEKRADPRPKISDLRGSGALEQHADAVMFLHRKHHREGGPTEAILDKQRNGPTGSIPLSLSRETVTFTKGEHVPEAQVDKPKKSKKGSKQADLIPAPAHDPGD